MSFTTEINRDEVLESAVNQFKQFVAKASQSLSNISPVTIKLTQPKLRKSSSRYYDFLFKGIYEITSQVTNQQYIIKISAHTKCRDVRKLSQCANQWCLDHASEYLGEDVTQRLSTPYDKIGNMLIVPNTNTFYMNLQINYTSHDFSRLRDEQKLPDEPKVINDCKQLYLACQKSIKNNKPMTAEFNDIYNQPSTTISWAEPNGRDRNTIGYVVCKRLRQIASETILYHDYVIRD